MGGDTLSSAAYTRETEKVRDKGSASWRGEQRLKDTGTIDPLVDPAGFGLIRRSLPRFVAHANGLQLTTGLPMPVETRFDTTGSMGRNVAIAIRVLEKTYGLLTEGEHAVLKRYDVQIANGIFGDVQDERVLLRSQFEMAVKIVEQLTMMPPEGRGGDSDEDPDYGLFAGAYLTAARINDYGLKGYDLTVSDARGRGRINRKTLARVFGDELEERLAENGHEGKASGTLPTTKKIVRDLLERAHAFFLQVGDNHDTWEFWKDLYGEDRVVTMATTEHLPYFQAGIIGLTEGVLELADLMDYFRGNCQLDTHDARYIANALRRIPVGAQAALSGFNDIPKKGDVFEKKEDLWPIGHPKGPKPAGKTAGKGAKGDKPGTGWKL